MFSFISKLKGPLDCVTFSNHWEAKQRIAQYLRQLQGSQPLGIDINASEHEIAIAPPLSACSSTSCLDCQATITPEDSSCTAGSSSSCCSPRSSTDGPIIIQRQPVTITLEVGIGGMFNAEHQRVTWASIPDGAVWGDFVVYSVEVDGSGQPHASIVGHTFSRCVFEEVGEGSNIFVNVCGEDDPAVSSSMDSSEVAAVFKQL